MNSCYSICNKKFDITDVARTFCKKGCDSDEETMYSSSFLLRNWLKAFPPMRLAILLLFSSQICLQRRHLLKTLHQNGTGRRWNQTGQYSLLFLNLIQLIPSNQFKPVKGLKLGWSSKEWSKFFARAPTNPQDCLSACYFGNRCVSCQIHEFRFNELLEIWDSFQPSFI